MKETKTIEVNICDNCKDLDASALCMGCKQDLCYLCGENGRLPTDFRFEKSNDPTYCPQCFNARYSGKIKDPLFMAGMEMLQLRAAYASSDAEFQLKAKALTAKIKNLMEPF